MNYNRWFNSIKEVVKTAMNEDEMVDMIEKVLYNDEFYEFCNDLDNHYTDWFNDTLERKACNILWYVEENCCFESAEKAEKIFRMLVLKEQRKMNDSHQELYAAFKKGALKKLIETVKNADEKRFNNINPILYDDIIRQVFY
mgnify:CR=1 FL=1